jgi:type II secretory pathway component GspD/PulD (secretin)
MNKSPLTYILTGALVLSALVSLVTCYLSIQYSREFRSLQYQVMTINFKRAALNALANDVMEYSKTHPAIDPILESVGKPKSAASAPGKPATK